VKGVKVHYVWKVGGHIVGKGKRFTPTRAMKGKRLTVTLTGTKKGFKTTSHTVRIGRIKG